jgi:hypothetical protein
MALTPGKAPDSTAKAGTRPRPRRFAAPALALALAFAGGVNPLGAFDAQALLRQVREPVLDLATAVEVDDVVVELGPARLAIASGVLAAARLADGRPVELVFVGEARFEFDPPDAVEASQLELFTRARSLDAAVRQAVLVLAARDELERLLARGSGRVPEASSIDNVVAVWESWLASTERHTSGVVSGLWRAVTGDPVYARYFAAWCTSPALGTFFHRYDPEELESITIGSYEAPELDYRERHELSRLVRVQQRRERWLGVRLQDLGAWDIWNSMRWTEPGADPQAPQGFEPRHYTIAARIRRDRMMLDGRARVVLEAQSAGRRSVRLALMRDLVVESVTGPGASELPWARDGERIVVLLPEPSEVGQRLALEVAFRGRALQWAAGRNHLLVDTAAWYPHAGSRDRATYDVTLRWPKKYDLIAPGRLVAEGRKGSDRWQRRRVELPAIAYSFALGNYQVERGRAGDTALTVAFDRRALPDERRRAEVVASLASALDYFEQGFGPYPLDELTVATVPRGWSQSHLGFITLSESVTGDQTRPWVRDTTIAHEVAHQWWGNLVGWNSYRDQWLSEGLANYAALLYDTYRSGERSNLVAVMAGGWRESLEQRTPEGRAVESIGPLTLGSRLNSSMAANAYRPIVYRKGAVVLAMLARAIGEERFLDVLRGLADSWSHDVLTTEVFLGEVEKASGLDLEGFARQYVYGTGIPQIYYTYEVDSQTPGNWTVRGEARRLPRPSRAYGVVRTPHGRFDVRCRASAEEEAEEVELLVPFELELESPSAAAAPLAGRLSFTGAAEAFEIRAERRPQELRLDPDRELLADFYSSQAEPKLYLRYRAEELVLRGETGAAEALYLEALRAVSPAHGRDGLAAALRERRDRVENLRVRLALVRMWIDQDRDAEAAQLLDATEASLQPDQREQFALERDVLRSRLEIRNGDPASARRRLKRMLRVLDPWAGRDWRDLMWQPRLGAERQALDEAQALLAIAAHATGRSTDYARAAAAARARGVDLELLERAGTAAPTDATE